MYRKIRHLAGLTLTLLALLSVPIQVQAQDNPVVVELYTSQGCSSCPPADKLLHQLAERDDVIALAWHVDYWDYIGWKDAFANPAHAQRQRGYAAVAGRRSIYTPQMIVNGVDSIVGARGMDLADAIQTHRGRDTGVDLTLTRVGETLQINATRQNGNSAVLVHMLRYVPLQSVKISRGENAGHTLQYANVVQDWKVLGAWNNANDLTFEVEAPGEAPVVVLLQSGEFGPILAAARLR